MQKHSRTVRIAAWAAAGVLVLAAAWLLIRHFRPSGTQKPGQDAQLTQTDQTQQHDQTQQPDTAQSGPRPAQTLRALQTPEVAQLLQTFAPGDAVTPSVAPYTVEPGLTNVTNLDEFRSAVFLDDAHLRLLAQNGFVVCEGTGEAEFFTRYEHNRYNFVPNFVTVDSLMHTYHLYFGLLLSRTEQSYLSDALLALSRRMMQTSLEQLEALRGTPWEQPAARNAAFFAVGVQLQDEQAELPAEVQAAAAQECAAILRADGIAYSALADELMDYSQYKPRGYYAGNETLERYFRAMMWYGQVHFSQEKDSLTRSALLMTLALQDEAMQSWEQITSITSFFAGLSDDLSCTEYAPAIAAAYGGAPDAQALTDNEAAYAAFTEAIAAMRAPEINSIPRFDDPDEEFSIPKGFRFFGQRFTVDEQVFQQLIYKAVRENGAGEKRMLPDTLDAAAALGSDTALELLRQQGDMDYANYPEHMQTLRETIQNQPASFWSANLSSAWLYTLKPLLEQKGEGYPSFMTNEQWARKSIETFAGSYTELKHDTVLYAKQAMAEMGGGMPPQLDDRGYVEPQPEVYHRFGELARQTSAGLQALGLIRSEDVENLSRLEQLAGKLLEISRKELTGQSLSEDDYTLIRTYGGTLEHFWHEAAAAQAEDAYIATQEFPASVVTDIATNPNGWVLEIATGMPQMICVVVPVEGELHLTCGVVYDFYQFTQPLSDRLTDTQWRIMIGQWWEPNTGYQRVELERPWWTEGYRAAY